MRDAHLRTVLGAAVVLLLAVGAPAPVVAAPDGGSRAQSSSATSCAQLKNRVGITDRTITIGNVADLTGPVPDLYRSATQAVRAYVAAFNSRTSICGRKLKLVAFDSRTDAAAERAATQLACQRTFAAVGSRSIYDDGGAERAASCGLPEVRAGFSTRQRFACATCFAARIDRPGVFANAIPDQFTSTRPAAVQKAAQLVLNVPSAVARAQTMRAVEAKRGWTFVYTAAVDVATFNYGPYVANLKSKGVRLVQFVGPARQAVRLAQAMETANYRPDVFLTGNEVLDPAITAYPELDGAFTAIDFTPLNRPAASADLRQYLFWLKKVAPNARPTPTGLFAWSAAKLFAQRAQALGGSLSRSSLAASLRDVHRWTGAGLHARQDIGGKRNSNCWRFLRLSQGSWRSVAGSTTYRCAGGSSA